MKYYFIFILMATSLSVGATDAPSTDALSRIESRLSKPATVCGSFAQKKVMTHLEAPLYSEGRFCVDQKQGILWRIVKPFPSAVKINSTEMIFYRDNREIKRADAQSDPGAQITSRVISSIITGNLSFLTQLFETRATTRPNEWSLRLKPKESRVARAVTELILKGNEYITDFEMTEKNGNETLTRFFGITTDRNTMNAEDIKLLSDAQ